MIEKKRGTNVSAMEGARPASPPGSPGRPMASSADAVEAQAQPLVGITQQQDVPPWPVEGP